MPWCDTTHFGRLEYASPSTVDFAEGLPGFESERQFVMVQQPQHHPLVFLQSIGTPALSFPALPVGVIVPEYQPMLSDMDKDLLGFDAQPRVADNALVLALIAVHSEDPTANLLAPIVVNLNTRVAAQCIDPGMRYSHRFPLVAALEAAS